MTSAASTRRRLPTVGYVGPSYIGIEDRRRAESSATAISNGVRRSGTPHTPKVMSARLTLREAVPTALSLRL